MAKRFTQKKLKWFIKSCENKTQTPKELAILMNIHEKSISRVYKKIKAKGAADYYALIGRPIKERPSSWKDIICKVYEEQHCGAENMERILDKHYKVHIPHNYIHKLITGRINHPQTNGRIERWFKTWIGQHWRFKSLGDFVFWYNCIRFHSAIGCETPIFVFYRDFQKLLQPPMKR